MAERTLDGAAKRELVRLLADAFGTRAELDQLTNFYLDTPLSAIPTEGTDSRALALAVINWCLRQGGDALDRFLAGAGAERPERADLRVLAARLAAAGPGSAAPVTEYRTQLLRWSWLILDYAYHFTPGGRSTRHWFSIADIVMTWEQGYLDFAQTGTTLDRFRWLLSWLPAPADPETHVQKLDDHRVQAAIDYLVARGFLRRARENMFGENYEITDEGRAYYALQDIRGKLDAMEALDELDVSKA